MNPTELKALLDAANIANTLGVAEPECAEYSGLSLTLGSAAARFRVAKTTPTKVGHFVTLWLRSEAGPIRPIDTHDAVSWVLVYVASGDSRGMFVFPASKLLARGVFSDGFAGGKRAIRVYAPWVTVASAQAARTQKWQTPFFVSLGSGEGSSDTSFSSGSERLAELLEV